MDGSIGVMDRWVCTYQRAVCVDTEGSQRVLTHSPTHALSVFVLALKWGTDEGRKLLKVREAKNLVRNSLFQECLPWVRGLGSVLPLISKVSMTLGSQCID